MNNSKPESILIGGIPIGTVFTGTVGSFSSVFLRMHGGIVDLGDPNHTWRDTPVHAFKVVHATLTIESEETR